MSAHRSLASLVAVSLASSALIHARPVIAPLERAVANDNRTPAGTMVGDTLALRLTVTPVAWHILGDSEPAFTLLAFAEEGKAPTIPGPLSRGANPCKSNGTTDRTRPNLPKRCTSNSSTTLRNPGNRIAMTATRMPPSLPVLRKLMPPTNSRSPLTPPWSR